MGVLNPDLPRIPQAKIVVLGGWNGADFFDDAWSLARTSASEAAEAEPEAQTGWPAREATLEAERTAAAGDVGFRALEARAQAAEEVCTEVRQQLAATEQRLAEAQHRSEKCACRPPARPPGLRCFEISRKGTRSETPLS